MSSTAIICTTVIPMSQRERNLKKKQKKTFLLFTRVLIKYLEAKDPNVHQQVMVIINDCKERNQRAEPGYESITASLRVRLKLVVSKKYWQRAEAHLRKILSQRGRSATSSAEAEESPAKKQKVDVHSEASQSLPVFWEPVSPCIIVTLNEESQSMPLQDGTSSATPIDVDNTDSSNKSTIVDPLLCNFHPLPPELEDEFWDNVDEVDTMFKPTSPVGAFFPAAFRLVETFAELVVDFECKALPGFVKLLHMSDMVAMMERLLEKQAMFLQAGKPCLVDVGYHYTAPENLRNIQTDGLLSKIDRDKRGIQSKFNGRAYGDGVYTGSNPVDHFGKYGSVGLVVLRVKGICSKLRRGGNHDTTVDSLSPNHQRTVVLRDSAQCVPIFQYNASMINRYDPACCSCAILERLHTVLQGIVDLELNSNTSSYSPPVPKSFHQYMDSQSGAPPAQLGAIIYNAPTRFDCCKVRGPLPFEGRESAVCGARLESESRETVRPCGHMVHLDCEKSIIEESTGASCPSCLQVLHVPRQEGQLMPSGRMVVSRDGFLTCAGHSWGTLKIEYHFASGIQSDFHPNPGSPYKGTSRVAYLPDSSEGRILLSRLQESFRQGLTFTIGKSQATGKSNVITWSTIPHKSNVRGGKGSFGYPDEDYFTACHAVLDGLNVKRASSDGLLFGSQKFG